MSQHKKDKTDKSSYRQRKQHQVEILKTSKAGNTRTPLHERLSEKPERESKAVRDSEEERED
jgi:hypothetical protein